MKSLKSHVITVRFDSSAHSSLKKESDAEGVSISEFVRRKILQSSDRSALQRIEEKLDRILGGSHGEE